VCFDTYLQFVISLFMFLYVGAEVSAGGLIYSYAVTRGLADSVEGALLNACFWGFFAFGRLIAIPLSTRFPASRLLKWNMAGCLSSLVLLLIFVRSVPMLWAMTALYGLSMASCFPAAISLADRYLKVTGKVASFFVVGASLGEMSIPFATALLFDVDSVWLFALSLIVEVVGLIVLLTLFWIGARQLQQKQEQQEQQQQQQQHGGSTELVKPVVPA